MTENERRAQGERLLKQMLGDQQAENIQRIWSDICPDFEKYVVGFLAGDVWSRPNLDLRTKSLATISALTALGRPLALDLNIRMALNNGASKQEIVETLLHLAPYAGFPAAWEALSIAKKVFDEVG
ncbi:MAG: 4-carboxymuconolactone decarboxylase [Gemmatales bacterium]|nr:MAG: 4-carboxymuconolactone decarboxylase [Gemmatales bacterium]